MSSDRVGAVLDGRMLDVTNTELGVCDFPINRRVSLSTVRSSLILMEIEESPAFRYFQKGSCRYGARCRYDHIRKHSNGNKELISKGKLFKQHDVNQNPQSAGPSGESCGPRI